MNTSDLGGPLLASVSRSFYLTIRILPPRLRAPIALAYLLARASDTIADSANAPAETRLQHLSAFETMLAGGGDVAGLALLQREILPDHPGERELIAQLDGCLRWLRSLDAADRDEIVRVLKKIIRGQTLDLKRFGADTDGVKALQTASELDEYTYLVAGSVGDFWTRMCVRHLPRYSALPCEPLSQLGVSYGKGLQLVNILRDLPADLRAGRCYLPEDELRAAGVSLLSLVAEPVRCRPVFNSWLEHAATQLEDGRLYIRALRPARLRAGCFLPWYLGEKTLQLMRQHAPLETFAKIKVPRATVRAALALGCVAAFVNTPLRAAR